MDPKPFDWDAIEKLLSQLKRKFPANSYLLNKWLTQVDEAVGSIDLQLSLLPANAVVERDRLERAKAELILRRTELELAIRNLPQIEIGGIGD